MKPSRIILLILAAVVAVMIYRSRPQNSCPTGICVSPTPPAGLVPDVVLSRKDGLTILEQTPFDLQFNRRGGDALEDLKILHTVLGDARLMVKDYARLPLADNRDFTRFLCGGNSQKVAWIRPDHPSINADGELVDRWGTPIFFHQESSARTSLRSAGPDKTFWTNDDVQLEDVPEPGPGNPAPPNMN